MSRRRNTAALTFIKDLVFQVRSWSRGSRCEKKISLQRRWPLGQTLRSWDPRKTLVSTSLHFVRLVVVLEHGSAINRVPFLPLAKRKIKSGISSILCREGTPTVVPLFGANGSQHRWSVITQHLSDFVRSDCRANNIPTQTQRTSCAAQTLRPKVTSLKYVRQCRWCPWSRTTPRAAVPEVSKKGHISG